MFSKVFKKSAPVKTVYLHIGTPKTGTTSIQNICHQNRKQLEQAGVTYIESGLEYTGHHILAASLFREFSKTNKHGRIEFTDEMKRKILSDVRKEISTCATNSVLISSEVFWKMPDFKKLRDAFEGFKVIIILYLRRQDKVLVSHYSEVVKEGSWKFPFKGYKGRFKDNYRYLGKLEKLESLFGLENLRVRVFEKERFINEDLWDDFIAQLDIDEEPCIENKDFAQSNQALPLHVVEFKRVMNSMGLSDKKNRELRELLQRLPRNEGDASVDLLLSQEDRKEFMAYYDEENRVIAEKYLKFTRGVPLFTQINRQEEKPYDSKAVTEQDIYRIAYHLINMMSANKSDG